MDDRTQPEDRTVAAEEEEAESRHDADRPPTRAEEQSAEEALEGSDEDERRRVAEHYKEMSDLGVEEKGEGRIS